MEAANLADGAGPLLRERLQSELECYVDAARAAWRELPLARSVFVQHVAERSSDGPPPLIHAADLYLACACAHQVAGAYEAFDLRYSEAIARAVCRTNDSPAFVDEASQRLREQLFVSARGLPKIASYGGRAALRTWLTIAASRAALMLLRREARRSKAEHSYGGDSLVVDGSPELAVLKRRYTQDFATALSQAFARLPDKERAILHLHMVDRLGIDALGKLYKVGRSTAARWLEAARTTLADETRRELRHKLSLTVSEYAGLAALVRSQLDVSVVKLLRRV